MLSVTLTPGWSELEPLTPPPRTSYPDLNLNSSSSGDFWQRRVKLLFKEEAQEPHLCSINWLNLADKPTLAGAVKSLWICSLSFNIKRPHRLHHLTLMLQLVLGQNKDKKTICIYCMTKLFQFKKSCCKSRAGGAAMCAHILYLQVLRWQTACRCNCLRRSTEVYPDVC